MPLDINNAKSYASEENLMKKLKEVGLDECRPLVVRNRDGRWTAVFGAALSGIGNPPTIAHLGFMVIN